MNYNKNLLPITDVCLNITEECNLACVYCFTEHHSHHMTLDIAKDAAKWLHKNAVLSSKIQNREVIPNIGFFGGEPTLMWDSIIVPLVKWIREEKKWKFTFGITSNCVLLDKEKVDFLVQEQIGLLISMDGNEKSQNINRPCKNSYLNSFDLVSKNLPYIAKNFPFSTYRSTISRKSAPYLFDNLMYAGKMGFEHVFAIINDFEEWDKESREIIEKELDKYCLYLIDACIKEQKFVKLRPFELAINKITAINTFLLFNEDNDIEEFGPEDEHRCGMGSGYGSINYKGEIYSCQEVASRQGEKDIFYIGNIYNGIDFKRIKKLRDSFLQRERRFYNYINFEKCKDCLSKSTCNANLCLVNNYIMHKDFSANADAWCWWNNMLLEKAMNVLFILGVNKNEFFKQYLIEEMHQQGGLFYENE